MGRVKQDRILKAESGCAGRGLGEAYRGGLVRLAAALLCLIVLTGVTFTRVSAEQGEQSAPSSGPSIRPEPRGREQSSQPAPEQSRPLESAPPAEPAQEVPDIKPVERPPLATGSLWFKLLSNRVDFDGGYLKPGGTYSKSVALMVESSGGWALKVVKNTELKGERSGEVVPPDCLTMKVSVEGGNSRVLLGGNSRVPSEKVVCTGSGGSPCTVTISYTLYVPWDLEPDTYMAEHSFVLSQI